MRRRDGGHAIENLVLLCRTCHSWAHANPAGARKYGFIVSAWGDVESTAIRSWMGWLIFEPEGFVKYVDEPSKEEE